MADIIRIIWINIIVFLMMTILGITNIFVLSSDLLIDLRHPWVFLTYMFTQVNLPHLCINMLWLYFFGYHFANLKQKKHIWYIYILGGITAGVTFLLINIFENNHEPTNLLGASGAIMAIVVATSVLIPNIEINILLGKIKLKWLSILTMILFTFGLASSFYFNHLVHLSGAITGLIYGYILKNRYLVRSNNYKERLIEKVKISGFSSLNKSEKANLLS